FSSKSSSSVVTGTSRTGSVAPHGESVGPRSIFSFVAMLRSKMAIVLGRRKGALRDARCDCHSVMARCVERLRLHEAPPLEARHPLATTRTSPFLPAVRWCHVDVGDERRSAGPTSTARGFTLLR